jgi:hypothetical protein
MTMDNSIIRKIIDGVEFFTVKITGESGMSKSGLAIFCGVKRSSITKLAQKIELSVFPEELPESLQPLVGKSLTLLTGLSYKNADILTDDACAAIAEYYAFDAPNPTVEAKKAVRGFLRIGMRAFIHSKTGWTPDPKDQSEQYLFSLILDEPRIWKEHFKPEWIAQAERLTKWEWQWRCMSGFLNATVYSYFPKPMLNKLDTVNPLDEEGRRPNKQHQHFREDVDEKALKKHIDTVLTLMEVSTSLSEFWRLMNAKFNGAIQMQMF